MYLLYVLYAVLNCSYCTLHTVCQNTCYCSAMSTVGALAHTVYVRCYCTRMSCTVVQCQNEGMLCNVALTLTHFGTVCMSECGHVLYVLYFTLLYCTVQYVCKVCIHVLFLSHLCNMKSQRKGGLGQDREATRIVF